MLRYAGLAALLLTAATPAAAVELSPTAGVAWTSGGFGEKRPTDVVRVPIGLKLQAGHWTFRATTEWVSINGPADISAIDEDGLPPPRTGGGKGQRQGFGDTQLAAKYGFDHLAGGPAYLDLQGKVRTPTGDSQEGLGLGAFSYAADAELGVESHGRGAYVDLARRFMPATGRQGREDGWAYEVGVWAAFDARTEIGVFYETRDAPVPGQDQPREAGAYVARRIVGGWRAELTLRDGWSPASPNLGLAFTVSWRPGGVIGSHMHDDDGSLR